MGSQVPAHHRPNTEDPTKPLISNNHPISEMAANALEYPIIPHIYFLKNPFNENIFAEGVIFLAYAMLRTPGSGLVALAVCIYEGRLHQVHGSQPDINEGSVFSQPCPHGTEKPTEPLMASAFYSPYSITKRLLFEF